MNSSEDMFADPNEVLDNSNSYTALKAKFFAQERKIYGILLLVYSPNLDYCEKSFLALTTYSLDYNSLGANSSFEKFYESIYNKAKEGISFQNINFKIKSALENDFSLIESGAKTARIKDVLEIEQDLKGLIKKAMSDKKVTAFTFIEKLSSENYINFFNADVKPQSSLGASDSGYVSDDYEIDIDAEVNIPNDATMVPASLILAPVDGKPISDLRQGHMIYIAIDSSNDEFERSTKDVDKDNIKCVSVTGNFYYEGVHHIGVQIRENKYSIIAEDANVKVKASQTQAPTAKANATKKAKRSSYHRLFVLGAIVSIFVLVLVLFFSFIWLL